MGSRMECPGCTSETSSVLSAVRNGEPCPHCGLSANAITEILVIRERGANEAITARCEEAIKQAEAAKAELAATLAVLRAVRVAMSSWKSDQ